MAEEVKPPVAIRITRPYLTEEEFLEREFDTLTRTSVVLLGAQPRPQGVILRFEIVLKSGAAVLRGEGRAVGYKQSAYGGEPGLTLRFTRLDSKSKALVDRAAALRDARIRGSGLPEARKSVQMPAVGVPRSPTFIDPSIVGTPFHAPAPAASSAPQDAKVARPSSRPPPLPPQAFVPNDGRAPERRRTTPPPLPATRVNPPRPQTSSPPRPPTPPTPFRTREVDLESTQVESLAPAYVEPPPPSSRRAPPPLPPRSPVPPAGATPGSEPPSSEEPFALAVEEPLPSEGDSVDVDITEAAMTEAELAAELAEPLPEAALSAAEGDVVAPEFVELARVEPPVVEAAIVEAAISGPVIPVIEDTEGAEGEPPVAELADVEPEPAPLVEAPAPMPLAASAHAPEPASIAQPSSRDVPTTRDATPYAHATPAAIPPRPIAPAGSRAPIAPPADRDALLERLRGRARALPRARVSEILARRP